MAGRLEPVEGLGEQPFRPIEGRRAVPVCRHGVEVLQEGGEVGHEGDHRVHGELDVFPPRHGHVGQSVLIEQREQLPHRVAEEGGHPRDAAQALDTRRACGAPEGYEVVVVLARHQLVEGERGRVAPVEDRLASVHALALPRDADVRAPARVAPRVRSPLLRRVVPVEDAPEGGVDVEDALEVGDVGVERRGDGGPVVVEGRVGGPGQPLHGAGHGLPARPGGGGVECARPVPDDGQPRLVRDRAFHPDALDVLGIRRRADSPCFELIAPALLGVVGVCKLEDAPRDGVGHPLYRLHLGQVHVCVEEMPVHRVPRHVNLTVSVPDGRRQLDERLLAAVV